MLTDPGLIDAWLAETHGERFAEADWHYAQRLAASPRREAERENRIRQGELATPGTPSPGGR